MPRSNIRGELRNWYEVHGMYAGHLYGDNLKHRKDGSYIYTGKYIELVDRGDYYILRTEERGVINYILWKDKKHTTK
jgi:hypothetical protein